ncbi:DNA-directed DNA polymerase B, partial [mine drainage metagenome]
MKKTEADYHGPVTARYLDYCLNDVSLTWELYERCRGRYRDFELTEHPSRVYSPASLAKAALKARGIVPPTLPPELTGRLMAGFYGGKVECRVVGHEVPDVAVLDFTSQYPSLYCLLGADRFLTAKRIETHDTTEEVRAWTESLTVEDLLKPETWRDPRMWTLCEVEADGEVLPLRSTYSGSSTDAPTIGWNHVTTEAGVTLPYMLPDLLAARLLGEKVPRIVGATTFEPKGQQSLRPFTILGTEVGPSDDLIRTLTEARIREKREKRPGWEARA